MDAVVASLMDDNFFPPTMELPLEPASSAANSAASARVDLTAQRVRNLTKKRGCLFEYQEWRKGLGSQYGRVTGVSPS